MCTTWHKLSLQAWHKAVCTRHIRYIDSYLVVVKNLFRFIFEFLYLVPKFLQFSLGDVAFLFSSQLQVPRINQMWQTLFGDVLRLPLECHTSAIMNHLLGCWVHWAVWYCGQIVSRGSQVISLKLLWPPCHNEISHRLACIKFHVFLLCNEKYATLPVRRKGVWQ